MNDVAASPPPSGARGNRIGTTVCVMLAALMQALDTTIANVALPYMQGSLSATSEQANWILTSYIVAAAVATPATGILENRIGRRALFIAAVGGFIGASALCGAAGTLEEMVVFRLVQGLFGAPLIPLAQAVLLDTYPTEQRGSAMAIFGLGVMLGPIIGPTLGGWLTEYYNWRWVFYVNVPFGLFAIAGLALFLSEPPREHRMAFDAFGFALLAIAIGALQLFLDRGEQLDWFTSVEIAFEAGIALLAFHMFLVHVATAEHAFIDPRMFQDRNFAVGLALIFAVGGILLATLALLTPYLENLMQYPVLEAGLALAPRGFGTMAAMLIVGRIINRAGARPLIIAGLCLTAFALYEMAGFTPDAARPAIIRTGLVQGFGLGLVFVPLTTATFATLAPRFRTQGTALFSLMRNIGSSIGISIVAALLVRYTAIMHADLAVNINPFRLNTLMQNSAVNLNSAAGRALFDIEVTRQAMAVAYANNFRLMMVAALALIPLVFLLRRENGAGQPP